MATFKACVKYQRSDGLYTVYIKVVHNRKIESYVYFGQKPINISWNEKVSI